MTRPLDRGKVAAARLWAVTRYPYLAAAVFATEIVERPGIGTVATDPRFRLYLDGDFVHRLSTPNVGRLVIHHVGHLLREHAPRANDARVILELAPMWVRACDAEINDDLAPDDLIPAHVRSLPQSFGGQPGEFAEQYYQHLQQRHGLRWRWWARDTQLDCGSGADGQPRAWDDAEGGVDDEAGALIRLKVAAAVREHAASNPDDVGGSWLRWADQQLGGHVDWRRVLAAEIRKGIHSTTGTSDYTYRRPSRRATCTPGIILPALHQLVPSLAIVCDTSASMDQGLLTDALTEIDTILRTATDRRNRVPVIACDTEVRAIRHVTRASQIELAGGGATDLAAGITAATTIKPRPSTLIVLTDGATTWPTRPPAATRVIIGLVGPRPAEAQRPPSWSRVVTVGTQSRTAHAK